ncbi:hypothetical protein K4L06_07105 [Lysobacter sp. BMK333-48F3]|uniref:hypothetical protein n=1 Tax=Lysobacter sp. BMK333-48F3 TaxID=2867962 RepID=UPI001C8C5F49|nr:hypothetical protein [Lysobacter sp. BMK333-48F3]MBX9401077.1 hypothetical protein [Lysobacter sp. BMK333-48F3]
MLPYCDPGIGIPVPEYGVVVPWGITRSDLYDLIPSEHFEPCHHGPTVLRFTLFGYRAPYWFNFVSRGWLSEVQLFRRHRRRRVLMPEFRRSAQALRAALPPPRMDIAQAQIWEFPSAQIVNYVVFGPRSPERNWKVHRHCLCVQPWPSA